MIYSQRIMRFLARDSNEMGKENSEPCLPPIIESLLKFSACLMLLLCGSYEKVRDITTISHFETKLIC
jgi:hypothetical protein